MVLLEGRHSNEILHPILDYTASLPHQTANNLVIFMNTVIVKLELTYTSSSMECGEIELYSRYHPCLGCLSIIDGQKKVRMGEKVSVHF